MDNDKTRFIKPQAPADNQTRVTVVDKKGANKKSRQNNPARSSPNTNVQQGQYGTLKDRFILQSVVGIGGMGVVFKATDKLKIGTKDPYVAIKILSKEFKTHPSAVAVLQGEATKSQKIAHPNIVTVRDFDRDGDTVFMMMEFLDGQPLDEIIRQHADAGLPKNEVENILSDICSALIYAHKKGTIHSDFKPGNIFVTKEGVAKVFDFGIAREVGKSDKLDDQSIDKKIGDLGALTEAYASVEMFEWQKPDVRDDIYALGCIAYEMYTGKHPFNRIGADKAKKQKLKPEKITGIRKNQWLAIEKALAFDRDDRIATVKEFWSLFNKKSSPIVIFSSLTVVLFCTIAIVAYQYLLVQPKSDLDIEKVKDELELTMRFENHQKAAVRLLERPIFSAEWEEELWLAVQGAIKINPEDQWLAEVKPLIIKEYRRVIAENIEKNAMARAEQLMLNAEQRYVSGLGELDDQQRLISAYKNRLGIYQQAIAELLDEAVFSEDWEGQLWSQVQTVREILEPENEWLIQTERSIFGRYIEQISHDIEQGDLNRAQRLIENAKRYARHAEDQQNLDAQRLALAQQQQRERDKAAAENKAAARSQFNAALASINDQLAGCRNSLNIPDFSRAVKKLQAIDLQRYRIKETGIVSALSSCIKKINAIDPARAELYKKSAMSIFPSNRTIAAIKMDPCDRSLAGLGGRGKGGICRDAIPNVGSGPSMVVVPSAGSMRGFAIGKYEVSVEEINTFCQVTASCRKSGANAEMPATNISVKQADSYLQWLSRLTKRKYRLPTAAEWVYAARAGATEPSPKRWCLLKSRGMYMGGALIRGTQGEQNPWGLVNHVGNASEWVRNNNGALSVVGGSYNTPMGECNFETRKNHNGAGDAEVGFRVLREISSM